MTAACASDESRGAFSAAGDRWQFTGTLTFDDAAAVFAGTQALPLPTSGIVDLTGLVHADSAALAVLLALRRRAVTEGRDLSFAGMPPMMASLARVYEIEDLIAART